MEPVFQFQYAPEYVEFMYLGTSTHSIKSLSADARRGAATSSSSAAAPGHPFSPAASPSNEVWALLQSQLSSAANENLNQASGTAASASSRPPEAAQQGVVGKKQEDCPTRLLEMATHEFENLQLEQEEELERIRAEGTSHSSRSPSA